ncbi:MAG TPA: amidase [Bacillota bacterium]|nr:amidase [Bacillota bacterium]
MSKYLLDLDITELANQLRQGKTTSQKLVHTYMNQIKHTNKTLNAVVETREKAALKEAKALDKQEKPPIEKYPLYGIPLSIKESFNVQGMKTTGGLLHRKNIIANDDAAIVKQLKDAGAIILCKSNTPTLCFCQETDNKLYGRTNNAWNKLLTAGGSSGGEGALIGVGGAAAGLGSDIGGSIRFPAHFNGVVGFKSGRDAIDATGHFPESHKLQERMLGVGPITKSVRDARLLYYVLTNNMNSTHNNHQKRVTFYLSNKIPLSDDTKNNIQELQSFLATHYTVDSERPPLFYQSAKIWQELMSVNGANHIKEHGLVNDRPPLPIKYLQEKVFKQTSNHKYLTWALIGAQLFKPTTERLEHIKEALERGDETVSSFLDDRLLVLPVYYETALPHGSVFNDIFSIQKSYTKYMPYVAYANVWGLPALTLPIGTDKNGLPIGIQIISQLGNESAIFDLGEVIEKYYYKYKRSNVYDEADVHSV